MQEKCMSTNYIRLNLLRKFTKFKEKWHVLPLTLITCVEIDYTMILHYAKG